MFADGELMELYESTNEEEDVENDVYRTKGDSDEHSGVEFDHDAVSPLNQCQTHDARKLCLFNLEHKLQCEDQYDIGGTYTNETPDLWFFCTTSLGPANRILNIFVCQRKKGTFQISVCDIPSPIQSNEFEKSGNHLSNYKLKTKIFKSSENDKCHYITSFCFNPQDIAKFDNTFCIPIQIDFNPKSLIDTEVLKRVKANHFLTGIFKRQENTDFVLESNSGKKHNVHKVVIAAHSDVIKEIVRNASTNTAVFDINDDEMETLLEFLYTGKLKSILDDNCYKVMDIAYKFKLEKLITLLKLAITQKINVKNAVEIAVLTEKYKLDNIQKDVFEFIKKNPEVLETEGWKNLNDVALTKKLFEKIYV